VTLTTGTRLGRYEIRSKIGAGGMGEVYRAFDPTIHREVAIKILPASLAADNRLLRFEQEASATGALNHPNILVIHHVDTHDGAPYIVSELLEGQTLRERLNGGRISQRKAIEYAQQIAHGLAAAHEKGIVHRDLKPENLFITKDERIKILDFGVAKLTEPDGNQPQTEIPTRRVDTGAGVVIGTVGYMSPEQVQGRAVDHRSDIFSFGVILFEMLSGRRAFQKESAVETMSAILKEDPPDLSETNKTIAPGLERVVNHCLEKNPEARFHSARDLAFALEALSGATTASDQTMAAPALAATRMARRELMAWAITATVILIAAIALIAFYLRSSTDVRVSRTSILPPEKTSFRDIVISPNGRRIAFTSDTSGKTQLWVRPLDSLVAQSLSGTEGANAPFWSPDSRFIGFFAQGKLKKIEATGGPAQTLCNATDGRGGTWNNEGVIIFSPGPNDSLYRVSAASGEPSPLTSLDQSRAERSHRWPYFLPDGRHFIYLDLALAEPQGIYVGSLDSKETKRLMSATAAAIYSPPGYLLFARETTLMAQRFDPRKLQPVGDQFPAAEHLSPGVVEEIHCSVSDTNVLAYLSGGEAKTQLTWFDRTGKELEAIGPPGAYIRVSLSPDDKQAAFENLTSEGHRDIWITDLARATPSQFTFDPAYDRNAVWSPDASRIVFSSNREGTFNLYLKPASGAGGEELLLKTDMFKRPTDWSRDGQFILYETQEQKTGWDLWVLPLFGDRKPFPFVQTEAQELNGHFSPDGHWIAYTSNEAGGTNQVYVRGFPAGGKWQISRDGGQQPRWSRDGKELFYVSADTKLMVVPVKADPSKFEPGVPRVLFDMHTRINLDNFDVSGDGQKFLINKMVEEAAGSPATVVLNWTADLK